MELRDVSKKENGGVSFMIVADEKDYLPFLNEASFKLQQKHPVNGYRKGKAPLSAVKAVMGKELLQTAAEPAIKAFIQKACQENNFQPVSFPTVNYLQNDVSGLAAICSFYNYPVLTELNYQGLKVERPFRICKEADIDKEIDSYMRNHRYVHEVERAAQKGDLVEVSFRAKTVDGGSFPFDHSEKFRYKLGEDTLFTGLDALLEGHAKGEKIEAVLTLPEDFHRQDCAGLTIEANVKLRGVWQRDVLPCTDEYVKEHIKGCETVEELRENYRQKLQKTYDETASRLFDANLRRAIAEQVTCPIPEVMISVPLKRVENGLRQFAAGKGLTVEEMLAAEGKTLEQVMKESREGCEEDVKVSVALDYVAQKEEIQISEKEINARLTRYAKLEKMTLQELEQKKNFSDYQVKAYEELRNEKAEQAIRKTLVTVDREYDVLPALF